MLFRTGGVIDPPRAPADPAGLAVKSGSTDPAGFAVSSGNISPERADLNSRPPRDAVTSARQCLSGRFAATVSKPGFRVPEASMNALATPLHCVRVADGSSGPRQRSEA